MMSRLDYATTNNGSDDWSLLISEKSHLSSKRRRAHDIDTAKAEAAGEALKARTPPERLAAAYNAMNIRDAD